MLNVISSILITLGVLSLLILVHELGHFLAAKIVGAGVEEFALGMGPTLFSIKKRGTVYKLNAFPIGGYVNITGETEDVKSAKSLKKKSKFAQIFVMLAGVTMNLIFAVIIYSIGNIRSDYRFPLPDAYSNFKPVIGEAYVKKLEDVNYDGLVNGKGAKAAGIPASGIITSVDNKPIQFSNDFINYLQAHKDQVVKINICDQSLSSCKNYNVHTDKDGKIGITIYRNYVSVLDYSKQKTISGVGHALNMVKLMYTQLGSLFSQARKTGNYSEVAKNVSSPVGVYLVVDNFKAYGLFALLALSADLSLVLAVMNLLPIPALDGGRVILIIGEAIAGKYWNKKVENLLINVSFILLLLLMVGIVFKDIIFFKDLQSMFK